MILSDEQIVTSLTASLRWILVLVFSWMILGANWGEGGIFHYASVHNELQRIEAEIDRLKQTKHSLTQSLQILENDNSYTQFILFEEYGLTNRHSCYIPFEKK
jgi:cell division protein FtsB